MRAGRFIVVSAAVTFLAQAAPQRPNTFSIGNMKADVIADNDPSSSA
jgi:hypothetical protein